MRQTGVTGTHPTVAMSLWRVDAHRLTSAARLPDFDVVNHHTDQIRQITPTGRAVNSGVASLSLCRILAAIAFLFHCGFVQHSLAHGAPNANGPGGMVWIDGGEFVMGSTDPLARVDEAPKHRVRVDGFWIDATEVTNRQFRAFVDATDYKTVAERKVDWDELKRQLPPGTPKPADDALQPGSLVFVSPDHTVRVADYLQWWRWTRGADWRHPAGPGSSIVGRDEDPVVHIAFEDALAYCKWTGKRLPTESEWEFAARGGLTEKVNVWGDEPVDESRANIWQGVFPYENTAADGFEFVSPVKHYPPNGYGLYGMAGNVWEWCSDLYRPDEYAQRVKTAGEPGVIVNPKGPPRSFDPRNPRAIESRVQRGGSFLCHNSYCASYRPSARMACPPDTSSQNVGFRCVLTTKMWLARQPNRQTNDDVPANPLPPDKKP